MQQKEVINISQATRQGSRIRYEFAMPDRTYDVYFSCDKVLLSGSVESALVLATMGGMRTASPIVSRSPMSETFLTNQAQLSKVFTSWFSEFSSLEVQAEEHYSASALSTERVGCFFTGGVDSFYSFMKHKDEITDLIYVHGYDIKLDDYEHRQAVSEMGRSLEQETGVRFIEIETNAVRMFKDYGKWGLHGHGYGLGAVARQLAGYLDRLYIPSSFAVAELLPWASHPDTDPLFSDEALEVVHDTCVERSDKINFLATRDLALKHLRVCWKNVEGAYNCGICEKCLRTMTTLYGVGVLEMSETFPKRIDPNAIRTLVVDAESSRRFVYDNIAFLRERALGESDVAKAWQAVLDRSSLHNYAIKRLRRVRKQWANIVSKTIWG